jgi:hypothetical protein
VAAKVAPATVTRNKSSTGRRCWERKRMFNAETGMGVVLPAGPKVEVGSAASRLRRTNPAAPTVMFTEAVVAPTGIKRGSKFAFEPPGLAMGTDMTPPLAMEVTEAPKVSTIRKKGRVGAGVKAKLIWPPEFARREVNDFVIEMATGAAVALLQGGGIGIGVPEVVPPKGGVVVEPAVVVVTGAVVVVVAA